jgi:hypothetical protein
MGSLSAGVGGYSLCLFLQLPSFWHFVDVCVCFFFALFLVVLLAASYLILSHFDLCVVISVFRLPPYSSYFSSNIFLNVMFLVSYTCIYSLKSSFLKFVFLFFFERTCRWFLRSPHQSVFRMADSACATHAPSLLRLSNNPSPPPLVQHGIQQDSPEGYICFWWLDVVFCV